jgi:hypothetical protein
VASKALAPIPAAEPLALPPIAGLEWQGRTRRRDDRPTPDAVAVAGDSGRRRRCFGESIPRVSRITAAAESARVEPWKHSPTRVCRRPLTRMNCLVITGKRYMQIGHRPGISGDCKLVPDTSRSINASPALRRLKSTPLGSVLCRSSRKLLQVGWSPRGPLIPTGWC